MRRLDPPSASMLIGCLACLLCVACGGGDGDDDDTPPGVDAALADAAADEPDAPADEPDAPPATPDAAAADAGPTTTSAWDGQEGPPEAACPTWLLIDTADPEMPTLSGGLLTVSTDADAEHMFYVQSDAALITPAMLVIEARVRLVSGAGSVAHRGPAVVQFRIGPDHKKNALFLADGEAFILADENVKGPSAAVATTDALHTYRIEANTTTGAVEVFRDGVSILTGTTFPEPDPNTVPAILWGEGTLFAFGVSEWASVTHNAHAPAFCP